MTTPLQEHWAKWLRELSVKPGDAYIQIRKFYFSLNWSVPYDVWKTGLDLTYYDIGYGKGDHKFNQLKRIYVNDEEIETSRSKLLTRTHSGKSGKSSQSCIAFRMGNERKQNQSMGYCMQTILVNWFKKDAYGEPSLIVELQYRSTELTKKFLADLKFLHEYLIPRIMEGFGREPTEIRFTFGTAYISTMYFPIMFQSEDPYSFLVELAKRDPKFKRPILASFRQWLFADGNPYAFKQQAGMHDFMRQRIMPSWSEPYKLRMERFVQQHSTKR